MYDGYLLFNETELINKARTAAYLRANFPFLDIKCKADYLHLSLAEAAYVSPAADAAPWYRSGVPHTGEFYGLFPSGVDGDQDSSREVTVTELAGDGAIQSLPRHGSKEVRVRATAFAKTERGMAAGLAWLRSVLDDAPCGPRDWNCAGRELRFYTADPGSSNSTTARSNHFLYLRTMFRVEPLEGPRVVYQRRTPRGVHMAEVEFIFTVGLPWQFTIQEPVATTTGVSASAASEVFCPRRTDSYDDLVTDPTQPAVVRPPRPPEIAPLPMPTSWSRYQMTIGTTFGHRHGRVIPQVHVITGSVDRRQLRVRFYRADNEDSCDFEGEFYVTYVPANSILSIDAVDRTVMLSVGGATGVGDSKPAANLVVGSNGRPPKWPSMACNSSYKVIVDAVGGLNGTTVLTDVMIRE
jgi:hypothetical protein